MLQYKKCSYIPGEKKSRLLTTEWDVVIENHIAHQGYNDRLVSAVHAGWAMHGHITQALVELHSNFNV